MTPRVLSVGVLGYGTIGSSVVQLLREHADDLAERCGSRLAVYAVAVRDPARERGAELDGVVVMDPAAVVDDPQTEIVVEVMGGVEPARTLIHRALDLEKPVVTANKELLANHGGELFEHAAERGVDLYFEAAVAGGIPLIRPLGEALAGERVTRVLGIVNGTTNYVLTRMAEDGMDFADALGEAQRLGYAERDPTDDVDGLDAAAKCAILASVAFNSRVVANDVYREGIRGVTPEDVEFAARLGYVVKLLAVAELQDGEIAVRVHPSMVPQQHPLAAVREAFNAVFLEGPNVGELMFYGRGAGGPPTAVAVVGDLAAVARNLAAGTGGFRYPWYGSRGIRPMDATETQYYLLLAVRDRPGVLAQVAGAFGDNGVSIKSVWQEGTGDDALLVLITHRANEGAMQRTVGDLRVLEVVLEVRSLMRVAGEE